MSFLAEIRRRKVFQVAAVYAVVAWLIVQVVSTIEQPLNLPAWFAPVVIVSLAFGFPIALILAWAFDVTPTGFKAARGAPDDISPSPTAGQKLTYLTHGLVLIAVSFLVVNQYVLEGLSRTTADDAPSDTDVIRASIVLGATQQIGNTLLRAHVDFSPNGRSIAYAAQANGTVQLYVRDLDQLQARPIPDTEGAYYPFYSPDGDWLAYFDDGEAQLKKVSLQGGPAQVLTRTGYSAGGAWLTDDTILVGTGNGATGRQLYRVSAAGGDSEIVTQPEPGSGHGWPEVLPGGRAVLIGIKPGDGGTGPARDGSVGVLSLDSGDVRQIITSAHTPRYTSTGHVLFARAGGLWAAPFDPERLEITGPEVLVVDGVQQDGSRGGAAYAISGDGTLVYAPGGDMTTEESTALVWVDREGAEEPLGADQRQYLHLTLSPDGQRLAYTRTDSSGNADIWTYDLVRGTSNRLTFNPAIDESPRWSPDGIWIVFKSMRNGVELYRRRADGIGQAERLFAAERNVYPVQFTPTGEQLLITDLAETWSLQSLSLDGQRRLSRLMDAQLVGWIALSPDGRWISYSSQESGVREIYISRFPEIGAGKWQVSPDGGAEPSWAPDGRELFYRRGPEMMVVAFDDSGSAPSIAVPTPLFMGDFVAVQRPTYAVSADGQRFLMLKAAQQIGQLGPGLSHLIVVDNWFEELERLAPTSR